MSNKKQIQILKEQNRALGREVDYLMKLSLKKYVGKTATYIYGGKEKTFKISSIYHNGRNVVIHGGEQNTNYADISYGEYEYTKLLDDCIIK